MKHFHQYICSVQFTVRTDHESKTWLRNFKNPSAILARWLEVLSTYSFEIKIRSGILHKNSDALSRRPCTSCAYCEKREHEDKEDDMRCNKISMQQVAIQHCTCQKEITTESTENVLECEENPSSEER